MLLGIDTGGTFTDFVLLDDAGRLRIHKVLSTPAAPERSILQGIRDMGLDPATRCRWCMVRRWRPMPCSRARARVPPTSPTAVWVMC
ncbi:MAG: hydantoinase/oxoprolinase N-terminal domain-containing protein [Gammaproteobacteria bacterium]|nr:hydantoinase/oxoprolinase N-terminal domain-containing protein [Gammaproteobacteria bacterium]